jgi:hypothetical protein
MITALDDYPVHQTSLPLAVPGTSDRNFYDRFWFNGFVGDGSLYFSVAMGFYPNRGVVDGGFSVLVDGLQHSLHLSAALHLDRTVTRVGPLRIETIVPSRRHRVIVDAPDRGFRADLRFEAGTGTHEEARQIFTDGVQTSMDVTRMDQFGSWSGWIEVHGKRIEVDPRVTNGTRDRSWGVRPCGEGEGKPHRWATQFYIAWSQTFWEDFVQHGVFFADARGDLLITSGARIPRVPKADEPVFARDTGETPATPFEYRFDYIPGTRRLRHAVIRSRMAGGAVAEIEYEPIVTFQMAGLGYSHPEWGHGRWKGELAVADETWKVDEIDLTKPQFFHVQQVCRVTLDGKRQTCGILEHAAHGPHAPSGFTALHDLYRG